MSLFIKRLFFRVFLYGIQFYRILILMYLMLASSIYLNIFWYPMILPFDMTNKTQYSMIYDQLPFIVLPLCLVSSKSYSVIMSALFCNDMLLLIIMCFFL